MNKNKFLVFLFWAGLAFLAFAKTSFAAVRCETQYGGGEICVTTGQLQINKQICVTDKGDDGKYKKCDIKGDSFKDNLFMDHAFTTSDFITFKLMITNVGDNTLHNVNVTDILPDFLFFTGNTPESFHFDTLNPGVTETEYIEVRVVSESDLKVKSDCDVNTAEATSDGNQHDKDTAKLCVIKQVLGVKQLPKTGPSDTFLILSLSTLAGLAGIVLVKFSK